MNSRILNILTELCGDWRIGRLATVDYLEKHGIDINVVAHHCGSLAVCPITLLPGGRFDLPNPNEETVDGCVIEARSADGDSVIDLCAWPVSDPVDVRTLCGAAPMVGLWNALNPATYIFDHPLVMHRTPLAWLKADCYGVAVVIPQLAARVFLEISDIGGRIGAEDFDHVHELKGHLTAMINRVKIVAPKQTRLAA